MKRFKIAGLCLVAVFALSAVVSSSALAKEKPPKPGLFLKEKVGETEEYARVTSPASAIALIQIGDCYQETTGTVESGKLTDKGSFTGAPSVSCSGKYTLEGSIASVDLKAKKEASEGTAQYKSTLVLSNGEGCAYEFKKLESKFETSGGETIGFGKAAGKLDKSKSPEWKTLPCATTQETTFTIGVNDAKEEAFKTELQN